MTTRTGKLQQALDARFPALGDRLWRIRCRRASRGVRREIRGSGNTVSHPHARLTDVTFDIRGNDNTVTIGAGCRLAHLTFHIRGDRHRVVIGEDCRFNTGGEIWMEDRGGVVEIGAGTTFEHAHLAVTENGSKLAIGRDCLFAYDIDVRTGDSHSILSAAGGERLNFAEDVTIGDHVWVGAHAILLKGTAIARDSVVATGAVVTGRHESPGVVLAGNPARVVREGITWSRERIDIS